MGEYSMLMENNIKVLDKNKLLKLRDTAPFGSPMTYYKYLIVDEGYLEVAEFGDTKIEGYWSNEVIKFFESIACCLEGNAVFVHNGEYIWRLVFKNGKVYRQEAEKPRFKKAQELKELRK